jgi:uncharacterized metal-binding protein YceD (DUF177 family)
MITKDGTIAFKVLEKQEVDLNCDQTDRWVVGALQDAAPAEEICGLASQDWAAQSKIQIHFHGSRLVSDDEFQVAGSIVAEVPALCARCGQSMMTSRKTDFIQYYQLVDDEAEAKDSGDADLIYTTDAHVNLRDLVSERLMLIEPMVEHHPDGFCHAPEVNNSPESSREVKNKAFAGLKGLKFD